MKNINVMFEDEEFEVLTKIKEKKGLSWREFILQLKEDGDGDPGK